MSSFGNLLFVSSCALLLLVQLCRTQDERLSPLQIVPKLVVEAEKLGYQLRGQFLKGTHRSGEPAAAAGAAGAAGGAAAGAEAAGAGSAAAAASGAAEPASGAGLTADQIKQIIEQLQAAPAAAAGPAPAAAPPPEYG